MNWIKNKIAVIVAAVLIALAGWAGHSLGSASGYSQGVKFMEPQVVALRDDVATLKLRAVAAAKAEEANRKDWETQVAAVKAEKTRIEKERNAQVQTLRDRVEYLSAHRVLVDPGRPATPSGGDRHNGKSPETPANGGTLGADPGNELSPATSRFLWRFAGEAERVRLDLISQVEYAKRLETELKACLR